MISTRTLALAPALLLGLYAAVGPARAQSSDTPPAAAQVVELRIGGEVFEGEPPLSLFGGAVGSSLRDLRSTIRSAASDPATRALVVRLSSPVLGWTQTQALRRELLAFRETGKPSYCHIDSAGTGTYLLASACSDVSMLPVGVLEIPGLGMGRMYLRGLLDKVGIRFQELRMGRYKSAAEQYTRTGPSDPVREETQAILDDLYDDLIAAIAENRELQPAVVRSLIDRAIFSADEALEAGLVDRVEPRDAMLARALSGSPAPRLVRASRGKKLQLQGGGLAGVMALMNELLGGPKTQRKSTNPKVAVIYGTGPIMDAGSSASLFGGAVMDPGTLEELFEDVREDDTVKAVVFRVSSPGGSAIASERIWRAVSLTREEKPVVVSMGDVAASGGYYVSCGADWIVADAGTLTGSIGVIGALPDMTELCETLGVTYEVFTRGARRGMISPTGRLSADGRDALEGYLEKIYDVFLSRVAAGRSMPQEAVAALAEGRVWTGRRALAHGLIDALGGPDAALAKAKELGRVEDDVEIITLPRPKSLFDVLSGLETSAPSLRAFARSLPAELQPALRGFEWIRSTRQERAFTVLPDAILLR